MPKEKTILLDESQSSALSKIKLSGDGLTLSVQFRTLTVYELEMKDGSTMSPVFDGFESAESKGKFWAGLCKMRKNGDFVNVVRT